MPRYFFHVIDGRSIIDKEGTEFPNLRHARGEAIRLAGAILRDEGDTFWNGEEWHMDVTDASGQFVLKLCFSADNQDTAPEEDHETGALASSVLSKPRHSRSLRATSLHNGGVRQVRT